MYCSVVDTGVGDKNTTEFRGNSDGHLQGSLECAKESLELCTVRTLAERVLPCDEHFVQTDSNEFLDDDDDVDDDSLAFTSSFIEHTDSCLHAAPSDLGDDESGDIVPWQIHQEHLFGFRDQGSALSSFGMTKADPTALHLPEKNAPRRRQASTSTSSRIVLKFRVCGWSEDAWDPAHTYILMGSVETTDKRSEVEVPRTRCAGRQLPADTAH